MNAAPLAVHVDFPAERAHDVFLALALRHLVVVDGEYAVMGIITRKDLIAA
jgi:CBS domain-containing protein